VGNLSDERFLPNLQKFNSLQGQIQSRNIDYALGTHFMVPPELVHKSNISTFGESSTPGATDANPFTNITSRAMYDKLPVGAHYQVPGHPVYIKTGTN